MGTYRSPQTTSEAIRVVTIDDHPLIREGIRSRLSAGPNIEVVAEGWVGEHLEQLVAQYQPDIVLLDLEMPDKEQPAGKENFRFRAFPTISRVRKLYPATRIIVISQHATQALIEGALDAGVNGYLMKDDALSLHLIDAVRAVHLNGVYFSGEVSRTLVSLQNMAGVNQTLTQRQREILQVIAENPDRSYAQHAARLNISEHTLSNHLRQIFERLEVTNITAAIVKAIQQGIINLQA